MGSMGMRGRLGRRQALAAVVSVLALLTPMTARADTAGHGGSHAPQVHIIVDGVERLVSPSPFIQDGRTLVPLRAFSNLLGADVGWDDDTGTATVGRAPAGSDVPILIQVRPFSSDPAKIEVSQSLVNEDWYRASVPPVMKSDRIFLPFRLITDALDIYVEWDANANAVRVDTSRPAQAQDIQEALHTLVPDGSGRLAVTMPSDGFHYSPVAVRALRRLTLAGNDVLDSSDRNSLRLTADGDRLRYTDINGHPVGDKYADYVIIWRNKYQAAVFETDLKERATKDKVEAAAGTVILGLLTGGESIGAKLVAKWLLAGAGAWAVVGEWEEITPDRIERCVSEAEARGDSNVMIGVVYTPWGVGGCINHYVDRPLSLSEASDLIHRR